VEPVDERRLVRRVRGWCAVMVIALPGDDTEVVADQMVDQPEDIPAWAWCGSLPVLGGQRAQRVEQPSALDADQLCELAGRIGRDRHTDIVASTVELRP